MGEREEKSKQAIALYEALKRRMAHHVSASEVEKFVGLFLCAIEEMEKLRNEER